MDLILAQNNEELQMYLEKHKINTPYKDTTKRPIARKVDYEVQMEDFSEKKFHTVKNAVICTQMQYICFVSPTFEGKKHDKSISNEECLTYPKDTEMLLDLGYIGYKATNLTVILPRKKPHKAELSLEQKRAKYKTFARTCM